MAQFQKYKYDKYFTIKIKLVEFFLYFKGLDYNKLKKLYNF